jgi:hypothetical protein
VSQSGAKRDNSQYRVRLPKSVSFPIADAFEGGSQRNVMSHRDKIEAVAVSVHFGSQVLQKCPSPLPQVLHHDNAVRVLPFEILGRHDGDGLAVAIGARHAINRNFEPRSRRPSSSLLP